ncbi:MAG: hypothetical protein AAFR54_18020 [Planctomycetota bacterium]
MRTARSTRRASALAAAATALAALTAPTAAQCASDSFEPNDACTSPFVTGAPFVQTGLSVFKLTDEDHFRVTVPPGEVVDVNVLFSHSGGDIDAFLYDAGSPLCGDPFEHLDSSTSSNDDESLRWTNLGGSPRDVIIKVLLFPGELTPCNEYDLTITTAPPLDPCDPVLSDDALEPNDSCGAAVPLPLGLTNGLWAERNDSDFYSYTLAAGGTLDVQAYFVDSIADVDLFLYAANGSCGGGFQSGELVSGFTQTDNERITWSNTSGSPMDVILEVDVFNAQDCNSYSLDVDVGGGGIGSNFCQANPNSTGRIGLMRGQGSLSVAANDVTLRAIQIPRFQFGIFIVSDVQGFVPNPGGSGGNLCVLGEIGRYSEDILAADTNGTIQLAIDLGAVPRPTSFDSVQAGETWSFQLWHRDSTPVGSNFTNGLAITFQP